MQLMFQSLSSIALTLSVLGFLFNPLHVYASAIELPDIGDASAGVVTPLEERRTGEAVMRNIRRAGGIIEDPLLSQYINHLGYQLVSASNSQMSDFHFFIINDKSINAFALPGGYIGVHYGLIMATTSESELASVLAHEIAHVTQRHHARSYEFGGSSIAILAAIIAAIVLGANNNELGEAAMASLAAGGVQQQINFTRNNEKEADRIGIELLASSGFDPRSMASFFEHLHKASRLYGPQAPEFLSTHPVNQTRIADSRHRASRYTPKPGNYLSRTHQQTYHLMRSRIGVLTAENKADAETRMADNLKTERYLDKDAARYAYVLSLMQTGKFNKARTYLDKLIKGDPQRIAYLLARAQLESRAGQHKTALNYYKQSLVLYPDNLPLTMGYARELIKSHRTAEATKLIQTHIRNDSKEPVFYKLLAEAEAQGGNNANAHVAMGEFYYRSGLTQQAIKQLSLALKNNRFDFYKVTRVEARLKEFKQEQAELRKASQTNE